MIINAIAKLNYEVGYGERLKLIVKFHYKGRLFKKKLEQTLCSTYLMSTRLTRYTNKNEYYQEVHKYLDDVDLVKGEVEDMIRNHFKTIKGKLNTDKLKNGIESKIKDFGKIEVKVKIDR